MPRAFRAATMTELHMGICDKLATAPMSELDMATSVDVQIHNAVAEAGRMEWDFDLKDMWLTKSRWSMMVRQYLDPVDLVTWLNRSASLLGSTGRGVSLMRTKIVLPRGGPEQGNRESRRWGSCMLGISYKAQPAQQITLYSRTSYLGYLAGMDLSVAWMCGNYLATMMGQSVEGFKFLWYNEAMQYHNFKSLAYFLNHPDKKKRKFYRRLLMSDELSPEDEALVQAAPALIYSRRWLQKALDEDKRGLTLGDISYNTYRRIKRRFHTEVMGFEYAQQFEGWSHYKTGPNVGEPKDYYKAYMPLPSVPIESLDFTPLGLPGLDLLDEVGYDAEAAAKAAKEETDDDE